MQTYYIFFSDKILVNGVYGFFSQLDLIFDPWLDLTYYDSIFR